MTKEKFIKISPLLLFLVFLAGSLSIVFTQAQENPGETQERKRAGEIQQQAPGGTGEENTGEEGGVAVIDFDHREYDFGRQLAEQHLEHTFKVYNRGTAPLKITSIRTG